MIQNNTIDNVEVKKHYYKSGALYWETPYVDGKMHGIEKWYYESGALSAEIPYVDSEIHGIVKSYEADKSNIYRLALYDKGRAVASVKFSI
jgi:antitoxin component YwqK of YwqJK toxin-antitoxin module